MKIILIGILLFVLVAPATLCEEYEYIVLEEAYTAYPNYEGREKQIVAKKYNTLREVLENANSSQEIYIVGEKNRVQIKQKEYEATVIKKKWVVIED